MAEINIRIVGVKITPNPCKTGEQIIISIAIEDIVFGILTENSELLLTGNGEAIEYCSDRVYGMLTAGNERTLNGKVIAMENN